MKKIILFSIVIVILIALASGYFIYNANKNTSVVPDTNVPAVTNQQPAQPENLSASVSIKNFAFNPTPLSIKVGTTVSWTNNDPMPHQIKSDTFNSSVLNSGENFSFTFTSPGNYSYSCAIHPSMKGEIIVTQ